MLAWKATFLGFSLWQKYTRGVLPPLKQAVFPFSILWHSSFSIFLKEIILSKPMPAAVRRGHFARSIDRPCSQYPSNKKYLRMLYKLTLYTFVHFSVKKRHNKNTQPRANLLLLGHRHRSEVLWNCGKMLKFQLGNFQTFQTGNVSKLLSHTVCRPKQGRSELCHLTAERLTSTNSPSVCTNMLPRRRFFFAVTLARGNAELNSKFNKMRKTGPVPLFLRRPTGKEENLTRSLASFTGPRIKVNLTQKCPCISPSV